MVIIIISISLYIHFFLLRACLHGGGGPQVGEVARLGGGNPHVHIISHLVHGRWGDPPRRVSRPARLGNTPSRGRILPCKRFKVG